MLHSRSVGIHLPYDNMNSYSISVLFWRDNARFRIGSIWWCVFARKGFHAFNAKPMPNFSGGGCSFWMILGKQLEGGKNQFYDMGGIFPMFINSFRYARKE